MQKTAFKVFLCSFSVSLLAMSAANRAFLQTKKYDNTSLAISGKNISLFIKDSKPRNYPVKKIDLSVLENLDITPPEEEISDTDDSIVVADELNFQDESSDQVILAENLDDGDDEDQKIFLADVVYSQDKPLEKPIINEKVVYSPQVDYPTIIAQTETKDEVIDKPVVYADNSKDIKESPPAVVKPKVNVSTNEKKEDSPIPLLYEEKPQNFADVSIGDADSLNHVAMKINDVPIESMNNDSVSSPEEKSDKKEWHQLNDNPWLIARSNGSKKNNFSEKNLGSVADENIEEVLNIHKPKKGVEVATETVKNLVFPLPEKLASNENLMPRLAYPEDSTDAQKEKAMNALSLKKEKEQQKLLTEIDDDAELSMEPPAEETFEEEPKKKGFLSSVASFLSSKTKDVKEEIDKQTSKIKSKLKARKNIKLAADANRRIAIVPKEIRMSFQTNRAEISGQTLRWVQAFAAKAAQDDRIYLEVRVDASRPTVLQQRRLNLLYNILTNKGVDYSKINVVYTNREPNSFILKMVDVDGGVKKESKKVKKTSTTHLQW